MKKGIVYLVILMISCVMVFATATLDRPAREVRGTPKLDLQEHGVVLSGSF